MSVDQTRTPLSASRRVTWPSWSTAKRSRPATRGTRSGWDGAATRVLQRGAPSASAKARTALSWRPEPALIATVPGAITGDPAITGSGRSQRSAPVAPSTMRSRVPAASGCHTVATAPDASSTAGTPRGRPGRRTDQRVRPVGLSMPTSPPSTVETTATGDPPPGATSATGPGVSAVSSCQRTFPVSRSSATNPESVASNTVSPRSAPTGSTPATGTSQRRVPVVIVSAVTQSSPTTTAKSSPSSSIVAAHRGSVRDQTGGTTVGLGTR